jgi:uncharacterized membrane protein YbhN (UPF0104 family)
MADLLDLFDNAAQAVAHRLAGVGLGLLALGLVLHVAKLAFRSRAWHNIAQAAYPEERLRFRSSLGAYLCGTGVNAVVPARSGEVLKLRLIRSKAPGTRYQGLASTLLTESLFDVVAVATVLVLGLALGLAFFGSSVPTPLTLVDGHPLVAASAALAVALAVSLLWRKLPRLTAGGRRGFRILHQPRRYLTTVLSWQLAALGLRVASILCFLAAFNLPATPRTALLVLGIQSAADLIPLTPNGAGTQQALLAVALGASAAGFGAGMQLATGGIEVVLALIALPLMTGSLNWRHAIAAPELEPAASTS